MMNSIATLFPKWGSIGRLHSIVSWLLGLALVLLWLGGYGPGGSACRPEITLPSVSAPVAPPPPVAAVAPTPAPAPAPVAAPAVPSAKLYFDLDKFDLPADADRELAAVIAYLKANGGAKAYISGYHDPAGNRAHNEELALNRARAVRSGLEAAGIPRDRIVMDKPIETTGTGDPREARRVEVSVRS